MLKKNTNTQFNGINSEKKLVELLTVFLGLNALSVVSDVINKLETNALFVWWRNYYWSTFKINCINDIANVNSSFVQSLFEFTNCSLNWYSGCTCTLSFVFNVFRSQEVLKRIL